MPTSLILLACVIACPLVMVAMMLFMRGHGREGGKSNAKEPERQ